MSKEKLELNVCVAKEEQDSQWEGHQSDFQVPRGGFGTIGCLISNQPTSVGLGKQQKRTLDEVPSHLQGKACQ